MPEIGLYAFRLQEMIEAGAVIAASIGGMILIFYLIKKTR